MINYFATVDSYSHGRDINGNGTARYTCSLVKVHDDGTREQIKLLAQSKRRQQVGYSGCNEAALWALSKLGYDVDTSAAGNDDFRGFAEYPLINFSIKQSEESI